METSDEYGGLQGLLQDLSSLSEPWVLQNIDRLCSELEGTIEDFKKLLDKKPKSNESRQAIQSSMSAVELGFCLYANMFKEKFSIDGIEYEVNDEFQEGALQLADNLDIDELEAARLFIDAQAECQQLDRSPRFVAVLNFHQQRECLLQCLRIILRESFDPEREQLQDYLREVIRKILGIDGGVSRNASLYARKILTALSDTEKWLQNLNDQVQKAAVVGPMQDSDLELLQLQSSILIEQHEHLGAILCYLFKGNWTDSNDLLLLIDACKKLSRFDAIMIHYVPALFAGIYQHGSPDGGSWTDLRVLHKKLVLSKETEAWNYPLFHSATTAAWLTTYSAWFLERSNDIELKDINLEKASEERSTLFISILDDGALEFLLAICSSLNTNEWRDPTREELVRLLLKDRIQMLPEVEMRSEGLRPLLMEYFDTFADNCIANMPDAVRLLKTEEDLQRLEQIDIPGEDLTSGLHRGLLETRTHLESFLVVTAFAFEHRIEAAQSFWTDSDGHLYGFLQWASKRQTVPRVAAFCEMLCAISEGEECADAAHTFLSEGDKATGGRYRRSTTMNWVQMFAELQTYVSKLSEKQSMSGPSPLPARTRDPAAMREPESPVMLSSYLRLTAHLCRESHKVREWLWTNTDLKVMDTLFGLASAPIPSFLRAAVFSTLQALVTNKTAPAGDEMWSSLDGWVFKNQPSPPSIKPIAGSYWSGRSYLEDIGESLDQCTSFVSLVQSMFQPALETIGQSEALPFPPSLGSAYRMPGVEPYVDFVLGQAFTKKVPEFRDQNSRFLRWNCLNFIATCLETFNESLVFIANQFPDTAEEPGLATYLKAHPFTRVMEWLFSNEVLKALYEASHQDVAEISTSSADSVSVCSLIRTLEIMSLVLDMQSSYSYISRSQERDQSSGKRIVIPKSGLTCFEDSVLTNLGLITDLCFYCGSSHDTLVLASLSLLRKLTSSPKLTRPSKTTFGPSQAPNRVIDMLNNEVGPDRVALSLTKAMEVNIRELFGGADAAAYAIKLGVLELLDGTLSSVKNKTSVGHLILGFACVGSSLDVTVDGLFAQGSSLFHAVIALAQTYPDNADGSIVSWMMQLKALTFKVLKHLWASKVSAPFAITEMRESQILPVQFARAAVVGHNTLWDGTLPSSIGFWVSKAPDCLEDFLEYRSLLFDYAVVELRSAASSGSSLLLNSIIATLMGTSNDDGGNAVSHSTVFDLFDFADLEIFDSLGVPPLSFFADINFDLCEKEQPNGLRSYDLAAVRDLIELQKLELVDEGAVKTLEDDPLATEASDLLLFLSSQNHARKIRHNFTAALSSWTDLITVLVDVCDMEPAQKTQMILHTLQTILPKLDAYISNSMPEASEIASLAETLVDHLGRGDSAKNLGRGGEVINDRLFQLFQLCIRGIVSSGSSPVMKETYYNICSQYLARITGKDIPSLALQKRVRQAVKTAGMAFIEVTCDDAHAGTETCRISALVVLNLLSSLDSQEGAMFVTGSIVQSNYLNMFIDSVCSIRQEIEVTPESGMQQNGSRTESNLLMLKQRFPSSLSTMKHFCRSFGSCVRPRLARMKS